MPIKASSSRHVDALIDDLRSTDPVARDAAIARLAVIGARAVDRVVALATDGATAAPARVAAFRALELITDPRVLSPALSAMHDPDPHVALAAVTVARAFLHDREDGIIVLDALTALALNRACADSVREGAVLALDTLSNGTTRPVREALLVDSSPRLRAWARGNTTDSNERAAANESWLDHDGERPLPADPDVVRQDIATRGSDVALSRLHRAIERIREREQQVPSAQRRTWLAARAEAHRVLAQRGSRLALYDLRETLESAEGPLPWSTLLSAVAHIGDATCLDALAAIYTRAGAPLRADSWHRQLVGAFHEIVARERITMRHAAAKKVKARWPEAWQVLWPSKHGSSPAASR